jgi:hypothetical protein
MKTKALALIVLASSCFAETPKLIPPEEFLGGAQNLRLLTDATLVSVEKVSISPKIEVRLVNGKLETKEIQYFSWDGVGPLRIEKGPVALPEVIGAQIKALLNTPCEIPKVKLACGYRPTHRIKLEVAGHGAVLIHIACVNSFDLYVDGKLVGVRPGIDRSTEIDALISMIDALIDSKSNGPNQALVPTATSVTPAADAPVAPAAAAAHL